MENNEWIVKTFAFIGMAVCIIIALIAIVWATCFAVKLLAKTFAVRVGRSYDVAVEDITKKSEAKKERNEIKRKAKADQKMELLNMKLESKQKIHEMKKQKLAEKLAEKEAASQTKLFGEKAAEVEKTDELSEDEKPARKTKKAKVED